MPGWARALRVLRKQNAPACPSGGGGSDFSPERESASVAHADRNAASRFPDCTMLSTGGNAPGRRGPPPIKTPRGLVILEAGSGWPPTIIPTVGRISKAGQLHDAGVRLRPFGPRESQSAVRAAAS
jgi:hypothetical protein